MPSISGRISNNSLLVDVTLQRSHATVGALGAVSGAVAINVGHYRGLIDTGAQRSMVSQDAARQAALTPRGKIRLGNVSSIELHNSFDAVIGIIVDDDHGDAMNSTRGIFTFETLLVAELRSGSTFDVLIGMDVIKQGDLVVRRDGSFTFAVGRDRL